MWRQRIAVEHAAALEDRHRLEERDGLRGSTREGHPFPVISPELSTADDRAHVLEHWLDVLAGRDVLVGL